MYHYVYKIILKINDKFDYYFIHNVCYWIETDGKLALIVPYMSLWHERVKYVRLNTSLLMELIGVEYYLKTLHGWYL